MKWSDVADGVMIDMAYVSCIRHNKLLHLTVDWTSFDLKKLQPSALYVGSDFL